MIYAFVGVVALVFVMIVVQVVRKNVDAPNWRQWFTVPEHDATASQPLPINHPAAIPNAPLPTDTEEASDPDAVLVGDENPEAPVAETPTDGAVPTDTGEPAPTEPAEVNPFEPAP